MAENHAKGTRKMIKHLTFWLIFFIMSSASTLSYASRHELESQTTAGRKCPESNQPIPIISTLFSQTPSCEPNESAWIYDSEYFRLKHPDESFRNSFPTKLDPITTLSGTSRSKFIFINDAKNTEKVSSPTSVIPGYYDR